MLVTNNRFGLDLWCARLDEGLLEMDLVEDRGTLTKLKAGAALLTGAWRTEQHIRSIVATDLAITRRRRHTWGIHRW